MSEKLTRRGALNLTKEIGRIASVVQENPGLLGIPPKIALDFARRCDMVSDAVEKTAAANFPGSTPLLPVERVAAKKADGDAAEDEDKKDDEEKSEESKKKAGELPDALKENQFKKDDDKGEKKDEDKKDDESKKKASASNGGWDPAQIGDSGRAIDWESDEPYMALFKGDELSELSQKVESGQIHSVDKFAKDLESWGKQGGLESRGLIDQLSSLGNRAKELKAQVAAAIEPLMGVLEGDIKKPHDVLLKSYTGAFTAIAAACDEARDDLIERQASADVQGVMGFLEEFANIAADAMGDMEEALRVPFQGFEMEKRGLRTAAGKEAGMASLLTTFQEMLRKNWRRMDQIAKNGEGLVAKAKVTLDGALKGWDKIQTEVTKGAAAPNPKHAGFDLTV